MLQHMTFVTNGLNGSNRPILTFKFHRYILLNSLQSFINIIESFIIIYIINESD